MHLIEMLGKPAPLNRMEFILTNRVVHGPSYHISDYDIRFGKYVYNNLIVVQGIRVCRKFCKN